MIKFEAYRVSRELPLVVLQGNDKTLAGLRGVDNASLSHRLILVVAVLDLGGREVKVTELLGPHDKLKHKFNYVGETIAFIKGFEKINLFQPIFKEMCYKIFQNSKLTAKLLLALGAILSS